MSYRNLSPQEMFFKMALNHTPKYIFTENTEFSEWKENALPDVLATLGDFPVKVELDPQLMAEWQKDNIITQRWLINVGEYISAILLINKPADIKEKCPAILCWHGHGAFGKEPVMGNDSTCDLKNAIKDFNYDYGWQMAKAGFITFAIDWIGCGERNDNNKPNFKSHNGGRDWCNLYYLHATMLGMTSISINITHGKAAIDFVCSLPEVDENRIGVMGLSGGGTMTLWTALCDERIKATEIICYSDLWAYFGIRDLNYCGMQVAPGLFKLVDLPELQGLLAPKPLLIDIGANDGCFKIDTANRCFAKVKDIYKAAGAEESLELDLHKSVEFFNQYL
jgi:hypothetical protein